MEEDKKSNTSINVNDIFAAYTDVLNNGFVPDAMLVNPETWSFFKGVLEKPEYKEATLTTSSPLFPGEYTYTDFYGNKVLFNVTGEEVENTYGFGTLSKEEPEKVTKTLNYVNFLPGGFQVNPNPKLNFGKNYSRIELVDLILDDPNKDKFKPDALASRDW